MFLLPWYAGEFTLRPSVKNIESAKEIVINAKKEMIESRRFNKISNMIDSKSCIKNEEKKRYWFINSNKLKQIKLINM